MRACQSCHHLLGIFASAYLVLYCCRLAKDREPCQRVWENVGVATHLRAAARSWSPHGRSSRGKRFGSRKLIGVKKVQRTDPGSIWCRTVVDSGVEPGAMLGRTPFRWRFHFGWSIRGPSRVSAGPIQGRPGVDPPSIRGPSGSECGVNPGPKQCRCGVEHRSMQRADARSTCGRVGVGIRGPCALR